VGWLVAAQEGGLTPGEGWYLRDELLETYWSERDLSEPDAWEKEKDLFQLFAVRSALKVVETAIKGYLREPQKPEGLLLIRYRTDLLLDALEEPEDRRETRFWITAPPD
jgi:hypothetical protein